MDINFNFHIANLNINLDTAKLQELIDKVEQVITDPSILKKATSDLGKGTSDLQDAINKTSL